MKKFITVLVICVGLMNSTLVEGKVGKQNFDELLRAIYNRWEEEVAYELLQERLWEYYNNPLMLNQASREELSLLCILTDEQLDQFFKHLSENGPLISIYEIQVIPGFDLETIRLFSPFVVVEEASTGYHSRSSRYKELYARDSYGLMRYQRTIDTKSGYRPNNKKNTVTGSPHHLLTRLIIKHPHGWE
nr:helix-hairpin-helix domain-containing protein [Amoebophilaceae bacterium]